jgi:hypothetical protein
LQIKSASVPIPSKIAFEPFSINPTFPLVRRTLDCRRATQIAGWSGEFHFVFEGHTLPRPVKASLVFVFGLRFVVCQVPWYLSSPPTATEHAKNVKRVNSSLIIIALATVNVGTIRLFKPAFSVPSLWQFSVIRFSIQRTV